LHGINYVGVELEPRFHELAKANVALWEQKWGHIPGYGQAVLLQGDSRDLRRVLSAADVCVASPPAALVVSSPPWQNQLENHSTPERYQDLKAKLRRDGASTEGTTWASQGQDYGTSPGQLGNMASGPVEAVVSSPPWEEALAPHGKVAFATITGNCHRKPGHKSPSEMTNDYGTADGQLGQTQGTTFWEAAKQIVAGVFAVLKPGGTAIWVTKNYIRAGVEVDFTGDWAKLNMACGFEWLHHHKALLVEAHGTQRDLFGADHVHETRRESFFRRLARKKTGLAIEYESILCFRKPLAAPLSPDEAGAQLAISSPPYASSTVVGGECSAVPIGRSHGRRRQMRDPTRDDQVYGSSPGQLGSMPEGPTPCL